MLMKASTGPVRSSSPLSVDIWTEQTHPVNSWTDVLQYVEHIKRIAVVCDSFIDSKNHVAKVTTPHCNYYFEMV